MIHHGRSATLLHATTRHTYRDSLSSSQSGTGMSVCLLRPLGMHDSFCEEQLGRRFLQRSLTQPGLRVGRAPCIRSLAARAIC